MVKYGGRDLLSEEPRPDGSMPFLDILITPGEDGSLTTTVYRKPTHTDLFMQWDSHHTISSKYSVIGTLYHRANTICSSPELLQQEEHLYRVLTRCKYPVWALNRVKIKMKTSAQRSHKKNNNSNTGNQKNNQNPYIVVPYYKGLSESLKRTCKKHGMQVYFKGGNTIRSLLVAPNNKDPMLKKVESSTDINVTGWSVIKNISVNHPEHWERGSRNIKRPHPPYLTITTPLVTKISLDNFSIVGREDQNLMTTIKEALYIRVSNPSLNRNIGKYHMPHICNEVLVNISELKIK